MNRKKVMHYLFFMVLACLLISASPLPAAEGLRDVEVKEAAQIITKEKDNSNFVILDVRTKREYDEGHVYNSTNIDFLQSDSFESEISKLDKGKTYLVYCRSGKRSKMAQEKMKEMGFKNVINMKGGFLGWAEGKNPYER